MFNWIWKRQSADVTQLNAAVGNLFGPATLGDNIIVTFNEYTVAHKSRQFSIPAWKRKFDQPNTSIREIWRDTRTEAFAPLLLHGNRDWTYLTGPEHQLELMKTYAIDRPHLKFPHLASGNELHDTVQAAWQCIAYMHEAAFGVGTPIEVSEGIIPHFEKRMKEAYNWWQEADAVPRCYKLLLRRERPPILIYILWEEVTIGAKEIAFAYKFGSDWRAELRTDIEYLSSLTPANAAELRRQHASMVDRMSSAVEPDDLIAAKPF